MAAPRRRWLLAASLLVAAALGTGCNVLSLPYFLFSPDDTKPAEAKNLGTKEKDKTVRVLLVATHPGLETRPEFIRVDRELCGLVAQQLQAAAAANKEKIEIVPVRQVERYKEEHPGWETMYREMAKEFDADYLVTLDIDSISLYDKGMGNLLYRGRANISVSITDLNKPDDEPITKPFACSYPSDSKGPVLASDT